MGWRTTAGGARRLLAPLEAVQREVGLRFDDAVRLQPVRDRAGAERMLVHDEEEQRTDERVRDVVDFDGAELAAVDAALEHRR